MLSSVIKKLAVARIVFRVVFFFTQWIRSGTNLFTFFFLQNTEEMYDTKEPQRARGNSWSYTVPKKMILCSSGTIQNTTCINIQNKTLKSTVI